MNSIDDYKKRADELETKLSSDPTVFSDPSNVKKLSNELKTLKHRIDLLEKKSELHGKSERNKAAFKEETDSSLRELLKLEISEFEEKISLIEKELEDMDNPDLQLDKSSCIVEIRAGTGGEEAALFASDIFKMYSAYIASKGWELALLSESFGSQGGMKEIIFEVNGEGAFGKLKNESGVHRVQRIPKTEAAGRIHTSAVSVVVLPQIDETEVEINPADIRVDVCRAEDQAARSKYYRLSSKTYAYSNKYCSNLSRRKKSDKEQRAGNGNYAL
jgi:peptide chain release factor 1